MTKILNSLRVTGTGSNNQALGVTGGYVSVSNKVRIGDWAVPTATLDINSKGTTSSTYAFNITTGYTTNNFYPYLNYSDDGVLTLVGAGLGYGATNSARPIGSADLVIGNNYYGSIELAGYGIFGRDQGGSEGINFYIRKAAGGASTYSRGFRFITATDRQFNLLPESDSTFSINFPTYNNGYIRLNSYNDSGKYFRISTDDFSSGNTHTQKDRFGIQGYSDYADVFFRNTSGVQIDHIKIQSNTTTSATASDGTPYGGKQSHFIIGASGSSNIGTQSITQLTGSLFIQPFNVITLTASYGVLKNTYINTNLANLPTSGNYNIFIGGKSVVTTGLANIVIGDYSSSNESGRSITSGVGNVVVGSIALRNVSTNGHNVAVGYRSQDSASGKSTVAVGYFAGYQNSGSSNIFLGNLAGYGVTSSNYVLHIAGNISESGTSVQLYPEIYNLSSSNRTEYGALPSWAANNGSNVAMIGSEGNYFGSSSLSSPGTYRTLFFGKGAYHFSNSLLTYVITTAIPAQNYFTGTGLATQSNIDAWGSNLELVAGIGRGGGTAGDLYFSTGQLTASGTSSLQDKVVRMTIKGGSGYIGIGLTGPSTLLHIYSTQSNAFRLQDGTEGSGRVLVSDANGYGSWTAASFGSGGGGGVNPGTIGQAAYYTGATAVSSTPILTFETNNAKFSGITGVSITQGTGFTASAPLDIQSPSSGDVIRVRNTGGGDDLNLKSGGTLYVGRNSTPSGLFVGPTTSSSNYGIEFNGQSSTSNNLLRLYNNSGIRFDISGGGVVSIGFTPSYWSSAKNGILMSYLDSTDGTDSNVSGVGLFATSSNGGSIILKVGQLTTNYTTFGVSGFNIKNIYGAFTGLNTTTPSGLLDINSFTSSSTYPSFRVRGWSSSVLDPLTVIGSGNIGIGTASPSTKLHIYATQSGAFRLVDTTQGTNKILVSDSTGVGTWVTASTYTTGNGLTSSVSGYNATFSISLQSNSGLTVSSTGLSVNPLVAGTGLTWSTGVLSVLYPLTLTKSVNFTVGTTQNGYLFDVTTSTSLITITTPTTTNGFEFTVRKVDQTIGVILVNGVYEFPGSSNYSYLTRPNQTITYKYNGTDWSSYVLDEGAIPPSTVLANMGTTYSHAEEFPVIDINDTIQGAMNYNQGAWSYDWLSGVVFSSYQPLTLTNVTSTSMFYTASNSYIGSTSSPLTIKSYTLTPGKQYRIFLSGTFSSSGGTATFYPKIGSVTFSSVNIGMGSLSGIPWRVEYSFKVGDVGATGKIHGDGYWLASDGATNNKAVNIMGTSSWYQTVDTTIDNRIDFLLSTALSTDSMTIISSTIERLA
jgi:hypothetical protein